MSMSPQLIAPPPTLRPYQIQVISDVYKQIRQGIKRILIFAPTGAGKTIISAQIIAHAASRGKKILFVVHRSVLIEQTHRKLTLFGLSANVGFIKAGYPEIRDAPVQIASVQTLAKRQWWKDYQADVICLDECHITAFDSIVEEMMEDIFPNALVLGLTATPFRLSKQEGMADIFDGLVKAPMPYQLINQGYLVKPSYYGVDPADLEQIRIRNGDYDESQLAIACDQPELIAKVVSEWKKIAYSRRTIAFAVNVQHSKNICTAFQESGIPAAHVDGKTPTKIRDEIYQQLADGQILVLSSCNALTEGFDVPPVSAIILSRPTKSKALHFQQIGRGLRLSPESGKHDCLVLDQAQNISRHGFVEDLQEITLSHGQEPGDAIPPYKVCPTDDNGCGAIIYAFSRKCIHCGYPFEVRRLTVALGLKQQLREEDIDRLQTYRENLKTAYDKKLSPGWAAMSFKEKYGHWPPDDWAKSAVFGETPTDAERESYQKHLQAIANRLDKPDSWRQRYLKLEFGINECLEI